MADRKTATLMLRLSPAIKQDLRALAAQEHRNLSNMVEVMILDYSGWHEGTVGHRNNEVPCACGLHARATAGGVRSICCCPSWDRVNGVSWDRAWRW